MDLDALGENRLERDMSLPIAIYDLKWHQRIKIRIIEFIKRIFRGSKKNIKEGVQEWDLLYQKVKLAKDW